MTLRRKTLIAAAIAVAAALLGTTVWYLNRDDIDARRDWVKAADVICGKLGADLVEIYLPAEEQGEEVTRWGNETADAYRKRIKEIEAITVKGDVGDLNDRVVSAMNARVEIYENMAEKAEINLTDTKDPTKGETALTHSLRDVDEAMEPYGGGRCGTELLTGITSDPSTAPGAKWFDSAEKVCLVSVKASAALDDRYGNNEIGTEEYLTTLSEITNTLVSELEKIGAPPDRTSYVDGYSTLLEVARNTAAALAAKDVSKTAEAINTWQKNMADTRFGACAIGISAGTATPSGAVVAPDVVEPLGDGTTKDGEIEDAATVVGYLISWSVQYGGADHTNNFGASELVGKIISDKVTAVPGDTAATSTTVSISTAQLSDPSAEPGRTNPWIIGYAVSDSKGRCAYGYTFGYPRLNGYSKLDAAGPCTGDTAAAAAPREFI